MVAKPWGSSYTPWFEFTLLFSRFEQAQAMALTSGPSSLPHSPSPSLSIRWLALPYLTSSVLLWSEHPQAGTFSGSPVPKEKHSDPSAQHARSLPGPGQLFQTLTLCPQRADCTGLLMLSHLDT